MTEEICECGHEYTFHDVLDNEACHLMDCPCKKFKPQMAISVEDAKRELGLTSSSDKKFKPKNHSPSGFVSNGENLTGSNPGSEGTPSVKPSAKSSRSMSEGTSNSKETLSDKIVPQICCKCGILDLQILYVKDVKEFIKQLKVLFPNTKKAVPCASQAQNKINRYYCEEIDKLAGEKLR